MNRYYWTLLVYFFIAGCGLGVILGCYLRRRQCESPLNPPTNPPTDPPVTSSPPDSGSDDSEPFPWLLLGIIIIVVVLVLAVIAILVYGRRSTQTDHSIAAPDRGLTRVTKYQVGDDKLDVVNVYADGLCLFHSTAAGESKGIVQPQSAGWELAIKTAADLDRRGDADPQGFGPELKNEAKNIRNWVLYNKGKEIPRPKEYPNLDAAGESLSNITGRKIRFFDQAAVSGNLLGGRVMSVVEHISTVVFPACGAKAMFTLSFHNGSAAIASFIIFSVTFV